MYASMSAVASPCRSRPSGGGSVSARSLSLSSSCGSVRSELVPLAPVESQRDPLLHATLRKNFDGQWFAGQVISIDCDSRTGERAYHVAYEDGDEEHMREDDVRRWIQKLGPYGSSGALLPPVRLSAAPSARSGWPQTPPPRMPRGSGSACYGPTPQPSLARCGAAASIRRSLVVASQRSPLGGFGTVVAGVAVAAVLILWGIPSFLECAFSSAPPLGVEDYLSDFAPAPVWSATATRGGITVDAVPVHEDLSPAWPATAAHQPSPELVAEPLAASDWHLQSERAADSVEVGLPVHQEQHHAGPSAEVVVQSSDEVSLADAGIQSSEDHYHHLDSMVDQPSPVVKLDAAAPGTSYLDSEHFGSPSAELADLWSTGLQGVMVADSDLSAIVLPSAIAVVCVLALLGSISRQGAPGPRTVQPERASDDNMDSDIIDVGSPCVPPSPYLPLAPSSFHNFGPQHVPAAQVGCWYVARLGGDERVVRIVSLGGGGTTAWAAPCDAIKQPGSSRIAFRKERADAAMELPMAALEAGPFQLIGGKPPPFIAERLERSFETSETSGWSDPTAAKALLSKASRDHGVESYCAGPAEQIKSKFVVGGGRFRYGTALRKMQEMGFEDTPALREIVTKNEGRVNGTLRQLGVA